MLTILSACVMRSFAGSRSTHRFHSYWTTKTRKNTKQAASGSASDANHLSV